jgi:hypothetical protein
MDAWGALFILASSVSLAGLVSSCTGEPTGRVIRERETLRKGIQRSLSDLNFEIMRLEERAADTDEYDGDKIRAEIGRLDLMKADLIKAGKRLRDTPQEEWNRVRDETLGTLDEARRYLRNEAPAPVMRHV